MFGKSNKKSESIKSVNKIVYASVEDNDEAAAELINNLRNGKVLVLNFEPIMDDKMASNKMLAFFAGASYALDGQSIKLKKSVYMFALKADFMDGSLNEYIVKYKD